MKRIRLTDNEIEGILSEVRKELADCKSMTISIEKYLRIKSGKTGYSCRIIFDPTAYAKMCALVDGFSSEVAWHFVTRRIDKRTFGIDDVLVYPQEITAATVDTNEEAYAKWLMQLPDEIFGNLRGQGHSHVSMGVSPSATDESLYKELLSQLGEDDYYIICIVNKSRSFTWRVYDKSEGVIFEDADIDVDFGDEIEDFLREAKSLASKPKPAAPIPTQKKPKPGQKTKISGTESTSLVLDDDDLYTYGYSWSRYANGGFYGYY